MDKMTTMPVLRIYVVEDHADSREMIRYYLEYLGHDVHVASTFVDALTLLSSAPCDLLLSDVGLPDGSGWELRRVAHLDDATYAVTMSGFGTRLDRDRSAAGGYRQHLVKPIDPTTLDALLEHAYAHLLTRTPG